jgi:hypothetical protein
MCKVKVIICMINSITVICRRNFKKGPTNGGGLDVFAKKRVTNQDACFKKSSGWSTEP